MARELKNLKVTFVSLVKEGANMKHFFLMKSDEDREPDVKKEIDVYVDKESENQVVYGVVYEPDVVDTQGDFMKADEIEKSAWEFMSDFRNIDVSHDFNPGQGVPVESSIAPVDFELGGHTIKKGSWVLATKVNDDIWKDIKSGEIASYSLAGVIRSNKKKSNDKNFFNKVLDVLKEKFGIKKDFDMSLENAKNNDFWYLFDVFKESIYNIDFWAIEGEDLKEQIIENLEQLTKKVKEMTFETKKTKKLELDMNKAQIVEIAEEVFADHIAKVADSIQKIEVTLDAIQKQDGLTVDSEIIKEHSEAIKDFSEAFDQLSDVLVKSNAGADGAGDDDGDDGVKKEDKPRGTWRFK